MKKLNRWTAALAVALLLGGCSTHKETVSTTETTGQPSQTVVQKNETTTTESTEQSGGVLSSTVDVVGEVVALPFRAVGALFRAIF